MLLFHLLFFLCKSDAEEWTERSPEAMGTSLTLQRPIPARMEVELTEELNLIGPLSALLHNELNKRLGNEFHNGLSRQRNGVTVNSKRSIISVETSK